MQRRSLSSFSPREVVTALLALVALVAIVNIAWDLASPKPAPAIVARPAPVLASPSWSEVKRVAADRLGFFDGWVLKVKAITHLSGEDDAIVLVPISSDASYELRWTTATGFEKFWRANNALSVGDLVKIDGRIFGTLPRFEISVDDYSKI